jgi:hypothetical protein
MTKTLDLSCGHEPRNPFNADEQYGFTGSFELVNQYWHSDVPYWLVWELKAVK